MAAKARVAGFSTLSGPVKAQEPTIAMIAAVRAVPRRNGLGRESRSHPLALRLSQLALLACVTAIAVFIAPLVTERIAAALTYGVWSLSMLAGGVAALFRARLAGRGMKLRWMLLGISLCGGAMSYFIASADHFVPALEVLNPLLIITGTIGSAAMLLSITVSFTGAPRSIVTLDLLQVGLYITLSYVVNAGSNPWASTVQSHVIISLLLALMLFLTAAVAPLSAATTEERRFFRIVAVYLGAAWIARFISGQVGYLWMHNDGNLYDLPAIGVCVALALFLMETASRAAKSSTPDRELPQRRLILRHLMPSLLAVASLVIALYIFLHAYIDGLFAVLSALLIYLSRTLLLQTHMGHETATLRHRNRQLEEISHRDALTGAGNRRSLTARYEQIMESNETPVALLLIDLDFFKQANDVLGHLHGDRILITVAGVLRSACSANTGSHVARFGGDEFAILLPQADTLATATLAETIRAQISSLALDAGSRAISVSIGSVVTQQTTPLEGLIRRADTALYRAKLRGRNRTELDVEDSAAEEQPADLVLVSVA